MDAREECLLTVHARKCEWTIGDGPLERREVPFSEFKLASVQSRFNLSVALFENRSYFGEKVSGTSAITAMIYAGTAQSLNSLSREPLARELLAT